MTPARRLTNAGLEEFTAFLDSLTTGSTAPYPTKALTDPGRSRLIEPVVEVERREFGDRLELGSYVRDALGDAADSLRNDAGFWSWMALYWFRELCPRDAEGAWKPGALARWIPSLDNARRYYRHFVLGPYLIVKRYESEPSQALAVLCQPPGSPGEVVEQIASRPQIVTCSAAMGVATRLFYDREKQAQRRGAGGKGRGSARRFAAVLMQFDRTFDLHSLTEAQLKGLMPGEFRVPSAPDSKTS